MKITLGAVLTLVFLVCVSIAYWFGAFSTSFNTNMCYSEVIGKITDEVKATSISDSKDALEELVRGLEALPLNGYESDCEDIKHAVEKL